MKIMNMYLLATLFLISSCQLVPLKQAEAETAGRLRIGFDIDDTILFSRDNFLKAPHLSDDPDHLDYAWINSHDSVYSSTITATRDLIQMLRGQDHEIFFITARPGVQGDALARFLSRELGFHVEKEKNLFFAPKKRDPKTGKRYTSKQETISKLALHMYYGDADNDMIAATLAGVRAVRVLRDPRSTKAYSKNYFGDLMSGKTALAPYSELEYERFINMGVGPYGESIFPIYDFPTDSVTVAE